MRVTAATRKQLAIIAEVRDALEAAGVRWWLFGGWGLDARIGRQTRDHHDIEFWVYHEDAERTREALIGRSFTVRTTDYPEESQEFEKDGVKLSSAFLHREGENAAQVRGRWSDWRFPPTSFESSSGHLGKLEVPVMSVEGMLAMKEQFPSLRNGRPLRDKDVRDIKRLRKLLGTGSDPA
ncbi:MAG TPA: hypothetical protein VGR43_11095 [Dehalococcoidia bacterium]|jgi:hypothetical protein|nr:hypothetical protein [Dehalococcoidia bacterium]